MLNQASSLSSNLEINQTISKP